MGAHFLLEASPTSAFIVSLSLSLFWPQVSARSRASASSLNFVTKIESSEMKCVVKPFIIY